MKRINGTGRTRNFACVVYPDSAPNDWLDRLRSECVPAFVSPIHDKDINPDGTIKKPHYHVLVMFDGVKTQTQWEEFRNQFGGVGSEIVQSTRGYARYLCHLDNPEKVRYNVDDVISIGGADYPFVSVETAINMALSVLCLLLSVKITLQAIRN